MLAPLPSPTPSSQMTTSAPRPRTCVYDQKISTACVALPHAREQKSCHRIFVANNANDAIRGIVGGSLS